MTPGASGPEHPSDAEQVWTVLDGHARVDVEGTDHAPAPAGTRAIPADGEPVLPPRIA